MKSPFAASPVLIVFAVLGVALSVTAQVDKPGPASICCCGKPVHEREVRRVPLARFDKDETGAIVYAIHADESWRRTEINVKRGQRIEISAAGIVRWAPDGIEKIDVTPEGTRPPYRNGWNYHHFPFPEAGIGSLVMRIGKGIYPAGSTAVIDSEDAGFIEFMVNDDVLHDNSGLFHVKVNLNPLDSEPQPDCPPPTNPR